MNTHDLEHQRRLLRIQRRIEAIYTRAAQEAALLGVRLDAPGDGIFSFDRLPATRRAVAGLMTGLHDSLTAAVADSVTAEWELANVKNNALCEQVLGEALRETAVQARYCRANHEARDAFLARRENGLDLSDRVWRYTDAFKTEIELGLDCGIRDGLSAAAMARDLKQYLLHPDKLFRRVRDEHGMLQLSRAATDFHPGRGVYRSSYKNALRCAVSETNMAYRRADHERWQQLDFVVGIEVRLSGNHTILGADGRAHRFTDICDTLAGRYPKDFVFTGWHPFCRCHAVPILKTDQELDRDIDDILDGNEPTEGSENEVTDLPDNFNQWVADNAERIDSARCKPYFLRDNFTDGNPSMGRKWEKVGAVSNDGEPGDVKPRKTALEIAEERHAARTPEDIRRIQDMADERLYGKEYVDGVHEIERTLGVKRTKRMTHDEANTYSVNPNFANGQEFRENCSTCSGVYVLRRMGFDVEALPNTAGSVVERLSTAAEAWNKWTDNSYKSQLDWMAKKGYKRMSTMRYNEFYNEMCKEAGTYEILVAWRKDGGHSTLLERRADGTLVRIDQQPNYQPTYFELCENGATSANKIGSVFGVKRVDNAMFNPLYIGAVKLK